MKLTVKLPDFTMTRGKLPGTGEGGLRLRRNLRRILGWSAVGLLFFVMFAWLSLPTRALAWRISHEAKARGYIVDIEDISISPFGGVTLENVQWTFAPSRPDQIPTKFVIEEVDVDISLLSLIMGDIDVSLEAQLDEGLITARYARGSDESSFGLEVAELPLYGVPKAAQALNAPLRGILAIKVDLTMPEHEFGQAKGSIELTCASCTIGDGIEKLYVPGSPSLKSGVVVPEIDLGTLTGRMTVEDGVATTDGPIETKSDDVWIELSGNITFKDPFAKSRLAMVLKFNLSESLQAESEPMRFAIQTANPKSKLDPPEQGLGFRLEGPVVDPRFVGIKAVRQQSRAEKRAKQRERDEKRRKGKSTTKASAGDDKGDKAGDDKAGDEGDGPKIGEPLDVQPFDPGDSGGKPALPTPRDPSEMPPADPSAGDGGNEPPPTDPGSEPPQYPPPSEPIPMDSSAVEIPPQDPPPDEAPQDGGEPPPADPGQEAPPSEEQPSQEGVVDGGGEGG